MLCGRCAMCISCANNTVHVFWLTMLFSTTTATVHFGFSWAETAATAPPPATTNTQHSRSCNVLKKKIYAYSHRHTCTRTCTPHTIPDSPIHTHTLARTNSKREIQSRADGSVCVHVFLENKQSTEQAITTTKKYAPNTSRRKRDNGNNNSNRNAVLWQWRIDG